MSEPTKSPPAKRLRLTDEPEQLPPDVAKPAIPPLDTGSDEVLLPALGTEGFDIKTFLLDFLQTDAGADDLANALKDRHIRDALKQRGVKVNAADDVGYNSLPLELRDQIREYVIADLTQDECISNRRECSPRLSAYACIDTEWQAAVESITFQNLRLESTTVELDQDLEFLMLYVVGNRRQYLQHISLPCTEFWEPQDYDEQAGGICLSSIRRLFSFMEQWPQAATLEGGFHLELSCLDSGWPGFDTQYTDEMRNKIAELPPVSQVISLSVSDTGQVNADVLLLLLSRLPHLRHVSIERLALNFWPWENAGSGGNTSDYAARVQCFFTKLSCTVPHLKSLEVATSMKYMDCPMNEYRNALISYSQKLQELYLKDTSHSAILECLAPFRAENFDPHASPPLSWPDLTDFHIEMSHDYDTDCVRQMRVLVLVVGRAIGCMPRIRNLQLELGYKSTKFYGEAEANSILFTLEVFWDDRLNGSRAELSVSQDWFDYDDERIGPVNVAKAVVSEEVSELWRKSLLKGSNAVLEVHVEEEEDPDEEQDC